METFNVIILVGLFVNIILVVFMWIIIMQSKQKIEDLSLIINNNNMSQETSRKNLLDSLDFQNKEMIKTINESSKNIKLNLDYQKSYLEQKNIENKADLSLIKDRLEYLATEVIIE